MALQDVIERVRGLAPPPNEEATKLWMILPILRELGWDDADPSRITPEYTVNRRGDAVDFALHAPQRVAAFIEAKSVGVRLDAPASGRHDTPEIQVLNYAFNAGVDICVLTSGLLWWLYLPREKGEPAERRFAELDIREDSVDQLCADFEAYLGYEEIVEHRAEAHARRVLEAKLNSERLNSEIPRIWDSMLADPPQALLELVEERVFSEVRLRPSADQVRDFLRGRPTGRSDLSPRAAPLEQLPRVGTVSLRPSSRRRPKTPVTGFRLWGTIYSASGWRDVWHGVAQAVHERHPDRFAGLVGSPRGKRSYVEVDRNAVRSPRQVGRYWIDSHGSSQALQGRCEYLLELCGYSGADLTYLD